MKSPSAPSWYRLILAAAGAAGLAGLRPASHAEGANDRESPPLRLVQDIPLPGVEGRLDHFTIDPKRKRVIFSALGNNSVEVVDAFAGRVIHTITGLDEPQGSAYIPELDKLYVANAGSGKVHVYNGTSFQLLATIEFGDDADNLRYDAAAKRLYVGYGDGAIAGIDVTTDKRLETEYKVDDHPESFQLETKGTRIFVNIATKNYVAVIDRKDGSVAKWKLEGVGQNFPMALDEDDGRLFLGTRKPSRLVVLDTASGKIVANLPAAGDMDDLFYDAGRKRIYIPGGDGNISVFDQKDPNTYSELAKIPSAVGCRTGTFYVKRDKVYLGCPPHANLGAAVLVFEAQD